jgi:hypothetical protein
MLFDLTTGELLSLIVALFGLGLAYWAANVTRPISLMLSAKQITAPQTAPVPALGLFCDGQIFAFTITNHGVGEIYVGRILGRAHPWFHWGEGPDSTMTSILDADHTLLPGQRFEFQRWTLGKEWPLSSFWLDVHWSETGPNGKMRSKTFKFSVKRQIN